MDNSLTLNFKEEDLSYNKYEENIVITSVNKSQTIELRYSDTDEDTSNIETKKEEENSSVIIIDDSNISDDDSSKSSNDSFKIKKPNFYNSDSESSIESDNLKKRHDSFIQSKDCDEVISESSEDEEKDLFSTPLRKNKDEYSDDEYNTPDNSFEINSNMERILDEIYGNQWRTPQLLKHVESAKKPNKPQLPKMIPDRVTPFKNKIEKFKQRKIELSKSIDCK